jgi:thioredoxin 1|uniref:Thioredoxin domain-containing protein n=1 Tax=viral metagenome TaxID=1070528 RepID=A0A6C0KQB6_9ZZZZ
MKHIKNQKDFDDIVRENEVVIIDFYTKWCGPCKAIAPFFEKLEKEFPHIVFVKCDCENSEDVSDTLGVKSIPTFIKFEKGVKTTVISGANKTELLGLVNGL